MVQQAPFGHHAGRQVSSVFLANRNGLEARLIDYGARLTQLHVPDRHGRLADIVLGFDTMEAYGATDTYFGATCGRYGNRIAGGRLTLDGAQFQLDRNEGANHLHGGGEGFDRKVWDIAALGEGHVSFTAVSGDGEMGYPGRCNLRTTYELSDDDRLTITMEADTDRTTVMNMIHHSYFNLAGQGSVLDQELQIAGDFYTPVDDALLATGEILRVQGTPFDFSTPKPIGRDIAALAAGYDHNWCLKAGPALRDCAMAYDPASGRRMTLRTSEPGVQLYTGGYLTDSIAGKHGQRLCRFAGFTLESQKFPGTPGFGHFPSCRLEPGETYRHVMEFAFGAD